MDEERDEVLTEAAPETAVSGEICNLGVLDLRFATSPDDLSGIVSLKNIGVILIPEALSAALARIPSQNIGAIAPIPDGANVDILNGQTHLTGAGLANGNPERILMVVGQAFVDDIVESVGYREIRVVGQLFAPRGSEAAISSKLSYMNGQVFYLTANPRVFMGSSEISAAFLGFFPEPSALVVMGELRLDDDVTGELLRARVAEIVLMGTISTPRPLLPLVQFLTREKMGEIVARD